MRFCPLPIIPFKWNLNRCYVPTKATTPISVLNIYAWKSNAAMTAYSAATACEIGTGSTI